MQRTPLKSGLDKKETTKGKWWRVIALVVGTIFILTACAAPTVAPAPSPAKPAVVTKFVNPDLLVETSWLAEHLNDANVRVVDVRKPDAYKAGHIRNSVNLDTTDPKALCTTRTTR